jgi:hypothetical protein
MWMLAPRLNVFVFPRDAIHQGRLISYMKTLHWRWRGVPALDAMEAACTRTEPSARPTVRDAMCGARGAWLACCCAEQRMHADTCMRALPWQAAEVVAALQAASRAAAAERAAASRRWGCLSRCATPLVVVVKHTHAHAAH